jgi:hypothetical protein
MMSTCCSKHVEAWNKYIKKECVKLVINQNYVKMHSQQNIKVKVRLWRAWVINVYPVLFEALQLLLVLGILYGDKEGINSQQ